MQYFYWNKLQPFDSKGFSLINGMQFNFRNSWVFKAGKDIFKFLFQMILNISCGINWYLFLHYIIKGTNVVEPCHMVFMLMGNDQGIQSFDIDRKSVVYARSADSR